MSEKKDMDKVTEFAAWVCGFTAGMALLNEAVNRSNMPWALKAIGRIGSALISSSLGDIAAVAASNLQVKVEDGTIKEMAGKAGDALSDASDKVVDMFHKNGEEEAE